MDSSQHQGSEIPGLIWKIGSPIIFSVGVFGNIMTISVLARYRKTSTSVFLMFLAVADMSVITTILPRWWIIYMFGIDIRHVSNGFCKVHWFVSYYFVCWSNSILVAVTIERIISISRPYKVKTWCTVNSAVVTSIAITVALIAFNGHILYGMKLFNATQHQYEKFVMNDTIQYEKFVMNDTIQFQENELPFINETSSIFGLNALKSGNRNKTVPTNCNTTSQPASEHDEGVSTHQFKLCNSAESEIYCNISNNFIPVDQEFFLRNNMCELVILREKTVSMCWAKDATYRDFFLGTFHAMVFLVYHVIPEVSILVGIIVILRHLAASGKLRKRMKMNVRTDTCTKLKKSTFESQSAQITRSLVLVNAVFLTFTAPVQIFLLGRSVWIDEDAGMTETQEIIWGVFNLLFYINHAVNFILYFLSGSRFRKQVKDTLRCNYQSDTRRGESLSHYINRTIGTDRSHSDFIQNVSSISQF